MRHLPWPQLRQRHGVVALDEAVAPPPVLLLEGEAANGTGEDTRLPQDDRFFLRAKAVLRWRTFPHRSNIGTYPNRSTISRI